MKGIKISFWTINILMAVLFIFSGSMAVQSSPEYLKGMKEMYGYPEYFPVLHGTLKIIGAIVLLIPRKFVFKHWAYSGLMITLVFAAQAHLIAGDEPIFIHVLAFVLLGISYYFYNTKAVLKSL